MNESKIAVRYAKALYLSAEEKNFIEPVKNDILLLSEVLKQSEKFKDLLKSPVTKPSEKNKWFNTLFSEKIHPLTMNFLKLLVHNNRVQYLQAISRVFIDVYNSKRGIKSGVITTAMELEPGMKKRMTELLKSIFKTSVELETEVKPSVIGGFILRVEDQQYDASVATRLNKLKTSLKAKSI